MAAVNQDISDLFFNTDHRALHDSKGQFIEHNDLEEEAKMFLACLDRLGIATPTAEELIADFNARI